MFGVLMICVAIVVISAVTRTNAGPAPQQDVIRLEARMGQLEQRLYSIENSLRTLEQQSRLANAGPRDATRDLELMRQQIQQLQLRVIEDECALSKLDERTLAPAAQRKSGLTNPCRRNVETPLRLPDDRE
jgi:hypothetical protein